MKDPQRQEMIELLREQLRIEYEIVHDYGYGGISKFLKGTIYLGDEKISSDQVELPDRTS